jgi:hypothetical protein
MGKRRNKMSNLVKMSVEEIRQYLALEGALDGIGNPSAHDIVFRKVCDTALLLYADNTRLQAQLSGDCPNCPNVGYYAAGDPNDPEQVQCEWCETVPHSKFNIAKREADIARLQAEVDRLVRYEMAWYWCKKYLPIIPKIVWDGIEQKHSIPQDEKKEGK